ncbi:S41 family peptidase [Curvivirga aplysinae]|uniref:S41 family peptidase n=1 Tax=Curvivirga aplysinae TaxID=2529852 RepID=UPI0012BBC9D5|nr:S41 family peptidase [Curvivirga aplysinae]MTI10345.1 S41 family peptidase [Curvivirga aplysinae]
MKKFLGVTGWAAALALGGTILMSNSSAQTEETYPDTLTNLRMLGDVMEHIRENYVDEVNEKDLIEAAIQGMLTSLDPHSTFLPPSDFEDMQQDTKGEFGGLGIEVTMEDGWVKVVSPIDDTPAYKAGIEAGDYITHLDGEPVQGLTLDQAVERMRGMVGEDIVLTIARKGQEPFDVTITRDTIKMRAVRYRMEDDDVGYIRISRFSEQTQPGLDKALKRLKEESEGELKGYVLDLRNNPGGLLNQAISVSDTFLERGIVVSTRGRDGRDAQDFRAGAGDDADGLPVVVLINGGSASASEIVAGALQDHGRAIIMGTKSFGKGSVQSIMPLSYGDAAIKMTTQRYYTPSGDSIQATGIEPDIIVEQARLETVESRFRTQESDLRNSLKNPDGEEEEGVNDKTTEPEEETAEDNSNEIQDYQLEQAVRMVKGVSIFQNMHEN